ncbi:YfhE family protein [Tuberibacillus sp. Marseille-P3662]|nr:YfhE family protein [Tuberibacillus sp. Marseille-P3662]
MSKNKSENKMRDWYNLNKTQSVNYQREFKRADRSYDQGKKS